MSADMLCPDFLEAGVKLSMILGCLTIVMLALVWTVLIVIEFFDERKKTKTEREGR